MTDSVYSTANYSVFEMRGGGMLLRHLNSSGELFFQPGDDANSMRETIDAHCPHCADNPPENDDEFDEGIPATREPEFDEAES